MKIEFKRLTEVSPSHLIELMNHPKTQTHLPLLKTAFDEKVCKQFVQNKETLWEKYGFGPSAFIIDGQFAGWGGLQPDRGEVDLVMILHPNFWGCGRILLKRILHLAFHEMNKDSVVVLFPPSRERIKALYRFGFKKEEEVLVEGEIFIQFRLTRF